MGGGRPSSARPAAHAAGRAGSPFWRFVRDYVVFSGWRDGRAGFVVSVVSAFSVFCKYATLLLPGEQASLRGAALALETGDFERD